MTREELFAWAEDRFGVEPDWPWEGDSSCVLRHRENGKWFGLIMQVPRTRLGLEEPGDTDVLTVKCAPAVIGGLLTQPGFHRAYHMNKEQWITARMDGTVPPEDLERLLEFSWTLTAPGPGRGRKRKEDGGS